MKEGHTDSFGVLGHNEIRVKTLGGLTTMFHGSIDTKIATNVFFSSVSLITNAQTLLINLITLCQTHMSSFKYNIIIVSFFYLRNTFLFLLSGKKLHILAKYFLKGPYKRPGVDKVLQLLSN